MRRRKTYRFSDEILVYDTIIAYIFGIIPLLGIVASLVMSIAMKGVLPEQVGTLLVAAFVMSLVSLVFGILSLKNQDGRIVSKRVSILIALVDIVLILLLYY